MEKNQNKWRREHQKRNIKDALNVYNNSLICSIKVKSYAL